MEISEFRSPQFSEDFAWMPAWFQQNGDEESVENIKQSQVLRNPVFKDALVFEEDIAGHNEANQFSREGGYSHCHLFLSGEDNSVISSSSKENVLELNLHLSTDVESVCCATQQPDSLDKLVVVNEVLPCFIVDTPLGNGNFPYSSDAHLANKRNISSLPIPETEMNDSVLKYPKFKIDCVNQCQEHSKVDCEEDTDICNAVELSIAASEALVLHDLVKEGSFSETFPTKAVLEVALRVKQARLDKLDENFHHPRLDPDLTESLSDLDDSMMADAYDDVGITYCMTENYLAENDNQCTEAKLKVQNVNICSNFEKNHHKANMGSEVGLKGALPTEPLSFQRQKSPGAASLLFNASKLDTGFPMLFQAKFDVLDQFGVNQTAGQAKAQQHDSHSGTFRDGEIATYLASDRFRSRWFGGWTDKDDARRISTCFIHETSFLSESADIAPDKNSIVQKHDLELEYSTLPSVAFEWSHKNVNESILQSQDATRCSSISLSDPLCSVVPSSIPAEADAGNECENNTDNLVAATSTFNVGYKQCMSNRDKVNIQKEDSVHTVPFINVEKLQIITPTDCEETLLKSSAYRQTYQKQSSSLKNDSMILPNSLLPSKGEWLKCNHLTNRACKWKLLSEEHYRGSTKFVKSISDEFLSSTSISAGKHEKTDNQNMECSGHLQLDMKITHEKRSHSGKGATAIETPIVASKEKKSPVILNRQSRRILLPSKTIAEDAAIGKHLKEISPLETAVSSKQKSKLHNTQQQNSPCDRHVLGGKRVHFSEAEEKLPHKNHQELQSSGQNGPTAKAGKRRKHSKSVIRAQAQENKNSLLNPYTKFRKQMIFQGIEFLLTGYSIQKEMDMEGLIRNFGGIVVYDVPSPPSSVAKRNRRYNFLQLPVLLCTRKLQTTKFLFACAINALILKVDWLTDSVAAGIILQPEKYMILPNRITWTRVGELVNCSSRKYIFEGVGIMLNGKHNFCNKLEMIVKHGGGHVFKSIHRLIQYINKGKISIGVIVVEDKGRASRHLKQCALELKIPMMPASWIVESLHSGKLLPFFRENKTNLVPKQRELSIEI